MLSNSDFMLQIKPLIVPSTLNEPEAQVMLPDGLLHPRFAQKKLGMGAWVTAHPFVIEQLHRKRTHLFLMQKTIVYLLPMQFCPPIYRQ